MCRVQSRRGEPTSPPGGDSHEPHADYDEGHRLQNGVGGEVVELHIVVVAQPPHEPSNWGIEPPLVQAGEAHHIPLWGARLMVPRWRHDPHRPIWVGVGRQLPAGDKPLEGVLIHVRPAPR
jgi:hypothetical protein